MKALWQWRFMGMALWLSASTALAWSANAMAADRLTVQVKQTQLREKAGHLSRILSTLEYGERVEVVTQPPKGAKDGTGWYQVKELKGAMQTGFVHQSALSKKKVALKQGATVASGASEEEIAMAGRGFDEEVEKGYRQNKSGLTQAYARLDAIQLDGAFNPSVEDVAAFMRAGGLGGGVS